MEPVGDGDKVVVAWLADCSVPLVLFGFGRRLV
jgi:hypothetical protein